MTPQTPDSLPSGPWKGWYRLPHPHPNKLHPMSFELDVKGSQVKGAGQDDIGKFELFGSIVGSNCLWIKQYLGRHQVQYTGEWDGWTVSGGWCIPRVWSGTFSLWPVSDAAHHAAMMAWSEQIR